MSKENWKFLKYIGIGLLILGIVLLAIGIRSNIQAHNEYQQAYDDWYQRWWYEHSASVMDSPKMPSPSPLTFIGPVCAMIGLSLTLVAISITRDKALYEKAKTEGIRTQQDIIEGFREKINPRNRTCKYCGAENGPNATKCASCGANLTSADKK